MFCIGLLLLMWRWTLKPDFTFPIASEHSFMFYAHTTLFYNGQVSEMVIKNWWPKIKWFRSGGSNKSMQRSIRFPWRFYIKQSPSFDMSTTYYKQVNKPRDFSMILFISQCLPSHASSQILLLAIMFTSCCFEYLSYFGEAPPFELGCVYIGRVVFT